MKLAIKKSVCNRVVFADGLGRSGKHVVLRILSHLEGGEQWRGLASIQTMCYVHFLGGIKSDFAAGYIQNIVEENTYYQIIGRSLNTRLDDASCIYKAADPGDYIRRSVAADGWEAVERFRRENRFPVFVVHNVLASATLMFEALPWAEWLHVVRHPVDLSHRRHARGWGVRETEDALSFNTVIDTPHGQVPWYAAEWAERFQGLNPMERAVEGVLYLHESDERGYQALNDKQRSQIHRFCFEDLVFKTEEAVAGISRFLKAPALKPMTAMLFEERCPRANDLQARRAIFDEVAAEIGSETAERLHKSAMAYEEKWGQESIVP